MIKKLGLATAMCALLLSGCGGGGSGSSSNPLNDKQYIIILTEVPTGICESSEYRAELSSLGLENFITEETANNTSCGTYGKTNDDFECAMELMGTGDKNCVVGFDNIPAGFSGLAKRAYPTNLSDTAELMSSSF